MEFFVDNWLWFLVTAIVILMTLIGYIAEKTDFGRKDMLKMEKPKKEKKKKEPKAKKELDEVLEEPKAEVQMTLATDTILEQPTSEGLNFLEDLNEPFGDVVSEETISGVKNNYEQPVEELNSLDSEEEVKIKPEDLNVPFGDNMSEEPDNVVDEVVDSQPEEQVDYTNIEVPNIELPDLDLVTGEENDNDDVWKF